MAFRRASRSSENPPRIKEELSAFSKEAGIYLKSRAELFAIESQEAGQILGKRLAVLIVGVISLIVTYLATLITIIYLLGRWFGELGDGILANWAGASLLIAAIHFAIAVVCLKGQRKIGRHSELFEYTRAEWQKDQQWIQNDEKQS